MGQIRADGSSQLAADPSNGGVLAHGDNCRSIREKVCGAKTNRGREGKRIPARRRRQESDAQFRRVRRQTSFSPSDMASIERRSPNGRRGSSYPTNEWAQKIHAQRFSRSRIEAISSPTGGVPASRSRRAFETKRLMPNLSRSTLYRCLKRRGLSRIGPTATCPPPTKAALKGPYRFEITTNQVAFHDPGDVIGVVLEVFLAIEEITKDVYAEVAAAKPENAARFLIQLGRSVSRKDYRGCYRLPSGIHRLESGVQRRHGLGRSSSFRRRLPRPRDRPYSVDPSLCEAPENPFPGSRNPIGAFGTIGPSDSDTAPRAWQLSQSGLGTSFCRFRTPEWHDRRPKLSLMQRSMQKKP